MSVIRLVFHPLMWPYVASAAVASLTHASVAALSSALSLGVKCDRSERVGCGPRARAVHGQCHAAAAMGDAPPLPRCKKPAERVESADRAANFSASRSAPIPIPRPVLFSAGGGGSAIDALALRAGSFA